LTISTNVNTVQDVKRLVDPDARLLRGAADPTRLAILRQLAAGEEVCACDFSACCEVAQPTVSHHLKVLRDAGWVTTERRGTWIFYRLRQDAVDRFAMIAGQLGPVGPSRALGPSRPLGPLAVPGPRRLPVIQPGGG
jgi:ArsR family transcriptional regulator, arsenate/arsenite/antimonite-responsive transcriptional repressor